MSELLLRYRPCPLCAPVGELRRRHARTLIERVIRTLTPFRPYRCNRCRMEIWRYDGPKASKVLGILAFVVAVVVVIYQVTQFITQ